MWISKVRYNQESWSVTEKSWTEGKIYFWNSQNKFILKFSDTRETDKFVTATLTLVIHENPTTWDCLEIGANLDFATLEEKNEKEDLADLNLWDELGLLIQQEVQTWYPNESATISAYLLDNHRNKLFEFSKSSSQENSKVFCRNFRLTCTWFVDLEQDGQAQEQITNGKGEERKRGR